MVASVMVDADVDVDLKYSKPKAPIEMAKILQQYGKDTELLKLADSIIQSQNGEIAHMRALLAKL